MGQMSDPQGVDESGVLCSWKHVLAAAKLMEFPQALELGCVQDFNVLRVQADV